MLFKCQPVQIERRTCVTSISSPAIAATTTAVAATTSSTSIASTSTTTTTVVLGPGNVHLHLLSKNLLAIELVSRLAKGIII